MAYYNFSLSTESDVYFIYVLVLGLNTSYVTRR